MNESPLDVVGRNLRSARSLLQAVMEDARRAAIEAWQLGVPETVIARKLGVDRMTVRGWLGKR